MEPQFIKQTMVINTYKLKSLEHPTSYYRQEPESVLPNRISCQFEGKQLTEARQTGRMLNKVDKVIGEVKASFTKFDNSPYKQFKPYTFTSRIFRAVDYPQLSGYAIPAITGENGRADNEIGMLVIYQVSDIMLKVFFVPGATTIADKQSVLEVVDTIINTEGGL